MVDATMAPAWWTLSFPPPAKRLSMNDRMGWQQAAPLKAAWRDAAYWHAYREGWTRTVGDVGACYVRVTFPVNDNRRRDSDNPAPTVKAIIDGLVLAGLWPDDSPEWVETLGSRFDRGSDWVRVELIRR